MKNTVVTLLAEIRRRADEMKGIYEAPRDLPAFAWPGGYTLIYVTEAGDILCAKCATEAVDEAQDDMPIGYQTHDEGESEHCANCNCEMESSYGPVDEEVA